MPLYARHAYNVTTYCTIKYITGTFYQGCRRGSRGFWLESEPKFSPVSGSYSTVLNNYHYDDYDYDNDDYDSDYDYVYDYDCDYDNDGYDNDDYDYDDYCMTMTTMTMTTMTMTTMTMMTTE